MRLRTGEFEPQDRRTARLQDCKTARLQDCKTARPQDCKTARPQDRKTARQLISIVKKVTINHIYHNKP